MKKPDWADKQAQALTNGSMYGQPQTVKAIAHALRLAYRRGARSRKLSPVELAHRRMARKSMADLKALHLPSREDLGW